MKNNRKKKTLKRILKSRFYRVYFAVVAVALAAIAIGLVWLNGVVGDYEISQPVHAAQEVAQLFEQADYDRLYDLDTAARDFSGGDRALYVESLTALSEGRQIAWHEAYSANPDERKYAVTLDGEKLAAFTLVPSGKTTKHGNTLWMLGSVTTNVALRGTEAAGDLSAAPYRVTAPAGYTVTVNGRTLTEADALNTGIPILPEDFVPSDVQAPTMTEYAFFSEEGAPQLSAVDDKGETAQVVEDGENAWKCPLKQNDELREKYSSAIIALAERIAKYTVKDLSKNRVLANVAGGSPAETILKKFSNSWAPAHRTAKVSDAVISDFYVLSDDCFTCHVDFTFTLTSKRQNDYVYPTSYTFCIVRRKGTGKLYNLTFN